jgi:hypothetical protein
MNDAVEVILGNGDMDLKPKLNWLTVGGICDQY